MSRKNKERATVRTCGHCTACCLTHSVPEIKKEKGFWCPSCSIGKGCKVYQKRPESCREFQCLWLGGTGDDSFRPDRLGAVFSCTEDDKLGQIYCVVYTNKAGPIDPKVEKVIRAFLDLNMMVAEFHLPDMVELFLPAGSKVSEKVLQAAERKNFSISIGRS